MKRMIVLLAVLLMAAPAMAAVTITAVDEGGGVVAISFSNDEATGLVRAIALDITADSGATIIDVCDINTEYNIHPGSIEIDPGEAGSANGEILDYGSAVCGSQYPGTKGGIGSTGDEAGVTIEMASLYIGEVNEPNQFGLICRVTVDSDCELCISENTIRGGIVMEDPQADPDPNTPVCLQVVRGCPCMGNLVNDTAPGDPNPVTVLDAFKLIDNLTIDSKIYEDEANWTTCADLVDTGDPLGDVIDVLDAFKLIDELTILSPRPCLP